MTTDPSFAMERSRTPDAQELVDLITRAKAGDEAAHRELYNRFKEPSIESIRPKFSNLDPHKIEEAFDEAHMAAVRSYDASATNASFRSLLERVLHNRCIDKARTRKVDKVTQSIDKVTQSIDQVTPSIDTPNIHLVRTEDGDALSDDEALRGRRLLEEWLRLRLGSFFQAFIDHYEDGVPWKDLGPASLRVQVRRRFNKHIERAIARGEADEVMKQVCDLWCGDTCRFSRCVHPIKISR